MTFIVIGTNNDRYFLALSKEKNFVPIILLLITIQANNIKNIFAAMSKPRVTRQKS